MNTIEIAEQIELILLEASAYGLRYEVNEEAKKNQCELPNISTIECYELAFNKFIK